MPTPTPSTSLATLRPDLAEFTQFNLVAARQGFIGNLAAPVIDVALQADSPGKIPLEQLLQGGDGTETHRASGAGYARGNFTFTNFSYATQEHGWEETLDDREVKRYRHLIDAERVAVDRATHRVLLNAEKRVADSIFNTTTWNGAALTTAVGTVWTDHAGADPIANVEAAVKKVRENSGLMANALVLSWDRFRDLRQCDKVIEAIVSSGAGDPAKASDINAQMLARVFDLDMVLVGGAIRNTAAKGLARSLSSVWNATMAMVCRVAVTGDIREPCIARTFHWSEDGSTPGGTVEEYRDETVRGRVIRVRHDVDEVVMYAEAGHLLTAVAA